MDEGDLDRLHAAWRLKACAFWLSLGIAMLIGVSAGHLIKRWLNT